METPRIEENEYTSQEALKEWEEEKDQNTLTQNIVALLGIHGMHCKFYEYQNASHITKAFEALIDDVKREEAQRIMEWLYDRELPVPLYIVERLGGLKVPHSELDQAELKGGLVDDK